MPDHSREDIPSEKTIQGASGVEARWGGAEGTTRYEVVVVRIHYPTRVRGYVSLPRAPARYLSLLPLRSLISPDSPLFDSAPDPCSTRRQARNRYGLGTLPSPNTDNRSRARMVENGYRTLHYHSLLSGSTAVRTLSDRLSPLVGTLLRY